MVVSIVCCYRQYCIIYDATLLHCEEN